MSPKLFGLVLNFRSDQIHDSSTSSKCIDSNILTLFSLCEKYELLVMNRRFSLKCEIYLSQAQINILSSQLAETGPTGTNTKTKVSNTKIKTMFECCINCLSPRFLFQNFIDSFLFRHQVVFKHLPFLLERQYLPFIVSLRTPFWSKRNIKSTDNHIQLMAVSLSPQLQFMR